MEAKGRRLAPTGSVLTVLALRLARGHVAAAHSRTRLAKIAIGAFGNEGSERLPEAAAARFPAPISELLHAPRHRLRRTSRVRVFVHDRHLFMSASCMMISGNAGEGRVVPRTSAVEQRGVGSL